MGGKRANYEYYGRDDVIYKRSEQKVYLSRALQPIFVGAVYLHTERAILLLDKGLIDYLVLCRI